MKRLIALILIGIFAAGSTLCPACAEKPDGAGNADTVYPREAAYAVHERSLFIMDTYMTLRIYGGNDAILDGAEALLRSLEAELSVTIDSSAVSELNREKRAVFSKEAAEVLKCALRLAAETEGAMDPSIYPVVKLWGFTTGAYRVPAEEEIAALLPTVDYRKIRMEERPDGTALITIPEETELDFGAVAKGVAGKMAKAYLLENGVRNALLSLGGNIQCVGAKADEKGQESDFKVAIRDPEDPEGYLGILSVRDKAVVTSGGYERFFEEGGRRYWHLMDPSTGKPAENGLISVTVVCDDGGTADALSTALFVMGEEKAAAYLSAHRETEAVLCTADGRVLVTPGILQVFTLKKSGVKQETLALSE